MGLNPICESIYLFRAQFAKRLFPKCLVSASKYPEREKQTHTAAGGHGSCRAASQSSASSRANQRGPGCTRHLGKAAPPGAEFSRRLREFSSAQPAWTPRVCLGVETEEVMEDAALSLSVDGNVVDPAGRWKTPESRRRAQARPREAGPRRSLAVRPLSGKCPRATNCAP